jgi:hypothetical protein
LTDDDRDRSWGFKEYRGYTRWNSCLGTGWGIPMFYRITRLQEGGPRLRNGDKKAKLDGNLVLELLGLLPGVVGVTEVTVRGGLSVDGGLELELLD